MAAALTTSPMSTTPPSSSAPSSSSQISPPSLLTRLTSPLSTRRARKQASIFFAGAAFFFFSTTVTRRAIRARHFAAVPARFTPSNEPNRNFSNPFEAVQALTLASLNVSSAAVMLTGGALWAMDVSNLEDMRVKMKGSLGGRNEQEVEEELQEWIAGVLDRKERKEERRREVRSGRGEGEGR